jgi:hypothetical protein
MMKVPQDWWDVLVVVRRIVSETRENTRCFILLAGLEVEGTRLAHIQRLPVRVLSRYAL